VPRTLVDGVAEEALVSPRALVSSFMAFTGPA
jgi:hypothetical protein